MQNACATVSERLSSSHLLPLRRATSWNHLRVQLCPTCQAPCLEGVFWFFDAGFVILDGQLIQNSPGIGLLELGVFRQNMSTGLT